MSLVLDLSGLERTIGWEQQFDLLGDPPAPASSDGVTFGRLRVRGKALWTGDTVLVEAEVSGPVEMQCSRCLASYQTRLSGSFQRGFQPAEGPREAQRRERRRGRPSRDVARHHRTAADPASTPEDGPEPPVSFAGDEVDLSLPAWETLMLELPMQPVCKPACRGLCPVCGVDRNQHDCGCRVDEVDPRLQALKGLLEAKERSD